MKRIVLILTLAALSLSLLSACGKKQSDAVTSLDQLREPGRIIGVGTGTGDDAAVREAFPEAEIRYLEDSYMGYSSVASGKLDAFVYGKQQIELAIRNGTKGVKLLDETVGESHRVAVGISPVSKIPDLETKLNTFIDEKHADGTLDDMYNRWVVLNDETMPDIAVPEHAPLRLRVATTGTTPPYTYYVGTQLRGYDIELARRFAAWLGAELELIIYDYSGAIAAAQSGDADCIMAEVFVTPERAEALPFSHPVFLVERGIAVLAAQGEQEARRPVNGFSDLEHARIGVTTGSVQAQQAQARFPDAEFYYFSSSVDSLEALRSGKIDAYADAEALVRYMMAENRDITMLDEWLAEGMQVGAVFPKTDSGRALCDEFSAFIREIRQNGVYDEIQEIWFGADESRRVVPELYDLPATNGTLRMAADTALVPFVYIKAGDPVGIDVDTVVRFCREYGYGLEIVPMDFAAIIPAVVSGKVDFAGGGIAYTPERAESVLYSEPTYEGGSVIAVRKAAAEPEESGFLTSVRESFEKTFIRENRWKLFLEGIGTTLLITALSILFGTALGFAVFLLCRKGNPVANAVTRFFVWLINGMPMVVLLMVLYYIVFGRVAISGTVVSVIGFTLVFGSAVYAMVKGGVATVDQGQTEAAYSLGYSDRRAFFRVVLPQALPHIMPSYKGQITALIKATAIVGYVAVQDLTKMGDIVRSRTYEAFFPLIAVAVIYFVLAAILTWIVNALEVRVDPRNRNSLLKGVKTGD